MFVYHEKNPTGDGSRMSFTCEHSLGAFHHLCLSIGIFNQEFASKIAISAYDN